jgi:hypothetical protein
MPDKSTQTPPERPPQPQPQPQPQAPVQLRLVVIYSILIYFYFSLYFLGGITQLLNILSECFFFTLITELPI